MFSKRSCKKRLAVPLVIGHGTSSYVLHTRLLGTSRAWCKKIYMELRTVLRDPVLRPRWKDSYLSESSNPDPTHYAMNPRLGLT
jgi:hypothetical protein